jgi:hypothetical protein
MWIACAYRDQALDPKGFVRAASNAACNAHRPTGGTQSGARASSRDATYRLSRRVLRLSTDFVGKHVDSLRIPRSSA